MMLDGFDLDDLERPPFDETAEELAARWRGCLEPRDALYPEIGIDW